MLIVKEGSKYLKASHYVLHNVFLFSDRLMWGIFSHSLIASSEVYFPFLWSPYVRFIFQFSNRLMWGLFKLPILWSPHVRYRYIYLFSDHPMWGRFFLSSDYLMWGKISYSLITFCEVYFHILGSPDMRCNFLFSDHLLLGIFSYSRITSCEI